MPESHGQRFLLELREARRFDETQHRQMAARGLQVLAQREDVDADVPEIGELARIAGIRMDIVDKLPIRRKGCFACPTLS